MSVPNIVKGQIALDPVNDLLYYIDESNVIVSKSLSWLKNSDNISTIENVVISGNLTVSGTTVAVSSETLLINDNIIVLNNNVTAAPTENAGIEIERGSETNVSIRWNETTDKWQLTNDGTNFYDIFNSSGITGNLTGNVTGNLTGNSTGTHTGAVVGNADTATKLLNARTISLTGPVTGSVSFDGTSNVSITTLLTAESSGITSLSDVTITSAANGDFLRWNGTAWINDAVNLSTDTVGSFVESLVAGTGITLTNNSGEGATPTVAVTANTFDAYGAASTAATNASTALSNHEADTTSIHGIADTSILVTTTGSQTLTNKTITSPSGLVKGDVGLGNVDNTSNATERAASATLTNKTLTSPIINTPTGIVKGDIGLGSVDNTADTAKPVSTAQQTALDLKANLSGPTFTGTVSGISASMVGLGSVDNTADTAKPVSTAQQTAIALKANIASPTFTGTVTTPILVVDDIEVDTTGATSGQVLKYNGTKFAPATESGPTGPTGPTGPAGPATTDASLLISGILPDARLSSAIARISSPTFTGVPVAPTAAAATNTTQIATTAFVIREIADNVYIPVIDNLDDLGDVTLTTSPGPASGDLLKWNGTAWVNDSALLAAKAPLVSPTFTGTVTLPSGSAITLPTVSSGINHSGSTSGTTKLQASAVASGTLTLPAVTGTLVSTGDTGTITRTMIENDTIINANIKTTAAIELGKIADATIDTKTTDYSLVLTDKNKFIKMNVVSSANTVTVPTNASVEFPIGSQIHIIQYGSGKTQVIPVSGTVTLYATPGAYLRAQFSSATLLKCDTNIWMLMGDLSAS